MYTVVMMLALTAGGDSPASHHGCTGCNCYGWSGCSGCYTSCHGCFSSCHGCSSSCHGRRGLFGHHRSSCNCSGCSSCHGGGLLSRLFHRNRCHGCSSSCHGCYGCTGCHGCHGGYSCHGCTGCHGGYYCTGCTGCTGCYCTGCTGCMGCTGCYCTGCAGCMGCTGCHGAVVPTPAEKVPVKPKESKKGMGAAPAPATIYVRLPATAKLTVDGAATQQTSAERLFTTPDLPQGRSFTYEFEAEFNQDGKTVTMSREVIVRAGEQTEVQFTAPAATNVAGR